MRRLLGAVPTKGVAFIRSYSAGVAAAEVAAGATIRATAGARAGAAARVAVRADAETAAGWG